MTHDLREAVLLADRVILLSQRPAHVAAEHTIDLPRPRSALDLEGTQKFGNYIRVLSEELLGGKK